MNVRLNSLRRPSRPPVRCAAHALLIVYLSCWLGYPDSACAIHQKARAIPVASQQEKAQRARRQSNATQYVNAPSLKYADATEVHVCMAVLRTPCTATL